MTDMTADMFNFDAMKEEVGADPFANQKNNNYKKDERFYTLAKDKNGSGAALIRFLPDSEKGIIQEMFKINTTVLKNGKKRFLSEFSPTNISLPCPFQEKWQELWNSGDKEGAKLYSRGVRYVTNIKVLKDPANPENEGKIFFYEMSGTMKDKIQNALDPSDQDRALGAQPKELFNPIRGNSFRLVAKKGANGQINYDSSEVINDVTSIYESVDEALEDIKANTHKLSSLKEESYYMSYDELVSKLKWVTFAEDNTTAAPSVQTGLSAQAAETQPVNTPEILDVSSTPAAGTQTQQVQTETKSPSDDLDSLLAGLA